MYNPCIIHFYDYKHILNNSLQVTETGDNEQQNHDRGDSEEVNEYQKNDGESWNQSNDERDSMEPPCDDQTNILEVHGHDKDNERYSEHQNISGRDAVEVMEIHILLIDY